MEHALSCPCGGFPTLRHNEVRDITAKVLSEVTSNVAIEPPLQRLSDEQLRLASAITDDESRLDIAAEGFWSSHNRAFFDVRVFNPFARANSGSPPAAVYRLHEREKIRAYEQRVLEVEHGSFTCTSCAVRYRWHSSWRQHSTAACRTNRLEVPLFEGSLPCPNASLHLACSGRRTAA